MERHALGNVAEGVCSFIAEFRGIGRTADAEGIKDDQEGSAHWGLGPMR
jgi:hypothetical protein